MIYAGNAWVIIHVMAEIPLNLLTTKYARLNAEIELCNWVNMWMSRVFVLDLVFTTV